MSFQTIILISVYLYILTSAISQPSSTKKTRTGCFKLNICKCVMKDGTGVINLRGMGDSDGFLGRSKPVQSENAPANSETLLYFNPCQPFSEPADLTGADCSNVAACLIIRFNGIDTYDSRYINYGRHEGNDFHYNDSMKTLSVSYYALTIDNQPQTIVHYHCSPNHSTAVAQNLAVDKPLQIWVESPCACPNACAMGDLGPGTILLIVLSISATAYFIMGSCAMRPFRTSSGVQIAPEESVWCRLCYLFTESKGGRKRRRYYSVREDTL
ncbi:uncharacterized protein FYW47_007715 [Aplochiton taeniatus]